MGCDRVALAFLCEAYDEAAPDRQQGKGRMSAPSCICIRSWPLQVRRAAPVQKLGDKAMEIRNELSKDFMVDYDDAAPSASVTAARMRSAPLLHHRGLPDFGDDKGRRPTAV